MKLTFLGAAREVTGSCYLLEAMGKNIIIDCGMEQGPNIYENQNLPVLPENIDYVLLTHAHIDHSGMLPMLSKKGYKGNIYLTRATKDLCKIMLLDSAGIQEFEAKWRKKKAKKGDPNYNYKPIYDSKDALKTISQFRGCDYNTIIDLDKNIKIRFIDAGHLLGSASIEVFITQNEKTTKIVFSGDIGNNNKPIIKNPQYIEEADYVVMESTYGDRVGNHNVDYVQALYPIIQRTFNRGGNVVIPSFAVGRMQELLYTIRKIKESNLIKGFDNFPVYVDSPLAVEATEIFSKHHIECFDEETKALISEGINPISFEGLKMTVNSEDSKNINTDDTPKIILSASGMCDAGRIKHHLKHNLWRKESTIVFVGFQVPGTLGRIILDGADMVKIFNEEILVRAEIIQLQGTSSHADMLGLLEWVKAYKNKPKKIFVTHGEDKVAENFAKLLGSELNQDAIAPYNGCKWDLDNNECLIEGNKEKINKDRPNVPHKDARAVLAFDNLTKEMVKLNQVVADNSNCSNRDLRKFANDIKNLCEKYKNDLS
ncbi:MAG: MBL fold metallo-hydrolase [Clostridia bacterium]